MKNICCSFQIQSQIRCKIDMVSIERDKKKDEEKQHNNKKKRSMQKYNKIL